MTNPVLSGMRVLLVDDEPDTVEMIAILLERAGADVVAVTTAAAALGVAELFRPHVLLTDIAMPNMDGYELAARLRAAGRSCPVVGVSAHAERSYLQRAKDAGFNAYLIKPIEAPALLATLREVTGWEGRTGS